MAARLGRWRRHLDALAVQLVGVLAGALVIGSLAYFALSSVQDSAGREARYQHATITAGLIERSVGEVQRIYLRTPARLGAEAPGLSGETVLTSDIPLNTAVQVSRLLVVAADGAKDLHEMVGSPETAELTLTADEALRLQERFFSTRRLPDFDALSIWLDAVRDLAARIRPQLAAKASADQAEVVSTASIARTVIIATTIAIATVVTLSTWLISRRLRRALAQSQAEQARLIDTTRTMERRNGQFQALYQVVTEVSETLSMKYVVQTAVIQARRLVNADMTALRLVKGNMLSLSGSDQDVDADVVDDSDLELGVGLVGRVAKRGKVLRIDEDAEASMARGEGVLGAQSGMVVPLIVGARIVGTLECWSRIPFTFTQDDERILEMMASQVATAVVAADTHEASEHDAAHDALTGLPNRRQLSKETRDRYAPALKSGTPVTFAMVDIDHFKRFNDEYGHKLGDITLQRVAEVLRSALRDEDGVFRYGGEEFTIVIQEIDAATAEALLDRVRAAVARTPLTGEDLQPVGPVTISVGFATGPGDAIDPEMLIKLADRALYQSKWAGRDRVTQFTADLLDVPMAA